MPLNQKSLPDAEHHNEISPEKEFGVVPLPRRESDHATGQKDGGGRKEEQTKPFLGIAFQRFGRNCQIDEKRERDGEKQAEILYPEPPGGLIRASHPAWFPTDCSPFGEPGNNVHTEGCGYQG